MEIGVQHNTEKGRPKAAQVSLDYGNRDLDSSVGLRPYGVYGFLSSRHGADQS